jgi:hypothetical protein
MDVLDFSELKVDEEGRLLAARMISDGAMPASAETDAPSQKGPAGFRKGDDVALSHFGFY